MIDHDETRRLVDRVHDLEELNTALQRHIRIQEYDIRRLLDHVGLEPKVYTEGELGLGKKG